MRSAHSWMKYNNLKMMDIKETPGDVHGRSWCLFFYPHSTRHRCETEHFARMSTLTLESIPLIRTRVKSHLFSISFHHYRRRCRCTTRLPQLRRHRNVRTRQIANHTRTIVSLSRTRCKWICLLSDWMDCRGWRTQLKVNKQTLN